MRALAEQVRALESSRRPSSPGMVATGSPPLDRLLPEQGLRRGTLVEWLFARQGGGAGTLAMLAARKVCREGGAVVVVDRTRSFYPPGAAFWGLDLRQLIVVRPTNDADDAWAWDQSLRSGAVAAVWSWPHSARRANAASLATGGRVERRDRPAAASRKRPRRSFVGRTAIVGGTACRPASAR